MDYLASFVHFLLQQFNQKDTKHERVDPLTSGKQICTKNTERSIDNEIKQKLPTLKLRTIKPILGKSYSDHAVGNPSTSEDSINDPPRSQSLGNHLREQHPSPSKFTLETLISQQKSDKKTEKLPSPEEIMPEETNEADIITEKEDHSNNNDESSDFEKVSKIDEGDDGSIKAMSNEKIISEAKSPEKEAVTPSYASATEAINDINSSPRELSVEAPQVIREEHATATEAINDTNSSTRELSVEAPQGIREEHATATESNQAINDINSSTRELSVEAPQGVSEEQEWDKGVSVKEYFKSKLEPGEDEKALSQVISEVISPKRSPTEKGVVEKVITAMSMLLQTDESSSASSSSPVKSSRSSSFIPLSVNVHEVEEESQEGCLQAN